MSGGQDAQFTTIYDSGTVSITVSGSTKSVSYGQGSTSSSVASALASAIANDAGFPANASLTGTTVNLWARTPGTIGNGYGLSASTTYNAVKFSQPSFPPSPSGATLTGGVDGQTIYDSGTVTLTISGCPPFTVNYQNGSSGSSVATAIRDAVNANGPCPVSASSSGSQVTLTADGTGTNTNYALSSSAATNYPQYFAGPSFSLTPSGMTGGQDAVIPSLTTPAVTLYTYDAIDNLTCVVQKGTDTAPFSDCWSAPAAWRPRRFAYDSLGRLTLAVNPESGTISYAYDNDGNVVQKVSPYQNSLPLTVTATYTYDSLHRLTQKSFNWNGAPTVKYGYDGIPPSGCTPTLSVNGKGRRTHMCDAAGSEGWSYGTSGEVLFGMRTTNGVNRSFSYAYHPDGTLKTITYPSGRTVSYTNGSAGRPTSAVGTGFVSYVAVVHYAPHGAPATLQNGSGGIGGPAIFPATQRCGGLWITVSRFGQNTS